MTRRCLNPRCRSYYIRTVLRMDDNVDGSKLRQFRCLECGYSWSEREPKPAEVKPEGESDERV